MKRILHIILVIILGFNTLIITDKAINVYAGTEINPSDLYAKSALLMDGESKRVLYEKNGYEKLPMASTTKILTCIVALENSEGNDVVEFSKYAASKPKVKLGVNAGNKFYMKDLLYSLMLESHNDTAVAIAECVGGSEEGFAKMMNERALDMGAKNSSFVTANGLDDDNHYTTAYDLAVITAEAMKNEEFVKIINTPFHTFSDIEGKRSYTVNNKDAFLQMMNGAIGVKTGFTGKAGYCFVGAVRQNGRLFISVVLGSGWPPSKTYKWKDTVKLMKYGIANYEERKIFAGVENYKTIDVKYGIEEKVELEIKGECSTLISNMDKLDFKYEVCEEIEAPVYKGDKVGEMIIFINNNEYKRFDITACDSVKKIDFKYSFWMVFEYCFNVN